MSKKNKVIYSNIQPNPKEAGVWVNTDDGNVKVEKDGKWVDDGGSGDNSDSMSYYRIDRDHSEFTNEKLGRITNYAALINSSFWISPMNSVETAMAIAGSNLPIFVNTFDQENLLFDNGWLKNIQDFHNHVNGATLKTSFLIPITKEEFYSRDFDYPVVAPV